MRTAPGRRAWIRRQSIPGAPLRPDAIRRLGWVPPLRGARRPPFAGREGSPNTCTGYALIHSRLAADVGDAYRAKSTRANRWLGGQDAVVRQRRDRGVRA